jgi:hypothetical protein
VRCPGLIPTSRTSKPASPVAWVRHQADHAAADVPVLEHGLAGRSGRCHALGSRPLVPIPVVTRGRGALRLRRANATCGDHPRGWTPHGRFMGHPTHDTSIQVHIDDQPSTGHGSKPSCPPPTPRQGSTSSRNPTTSPLQLAGRASSVERRASSVIGRAGTHVRPHAPFSLEGNASPAADAVLASAAVRGHPRRTVFTVPHPHGRATSHRVAPEPPADGSGAVPPRRSPAARHPDGPATAVVTTRRPRAGSPRRRPPSSLHRALTNGWGAAATAADAERMVTVVRLLLGAMTTDDRSP